MSATSSYHGLVDNKWLTPKTLNQDHRHMRRGGGGGGGGWGDCSPPRIFQIAIFGQKKKSCNIWAKPLDFRTSNGENIRATDLSPPKQNWSRTPMIKMFPIRCWSMTSLAMTPCPLSWFAGSRTVKFHSRLYSLRITLKYTTLVRMHCGSAWTCIHDKWSGSDERPPIAYWNPLLRQLCPWIKHLSLPSPSDRT